MQPPTEASSCTGSPRTPQKITAHGCAPAPQPRKGGGGAHPSSPGSPGQDADEHTAPNPPGQRCWVFPKQAPGPTADRQGSQQGREELSPAGSPGNSPFPGKQPDSTIQRAISQWQKKGTCQEKVRGAALRDPGSRCPAQCAPSCPLSPKPCRISSLCRDPGPRPSADPLPHTGTGWEPGPHPDSAAGSRAGSLSHAPKASSRAKQETLLLLFLPLAPHASSPRNLVLQPSGRRDAPVVPTAPAEE